MTDDYRTPWPWRLLFWTLYDRPWQHRVLGRWLP